MIWAKKFEHCWLSDSRLEVRFADPDRRAPQLYRRSAAQRWEIVPVITDVGLPLESVNMTLSFATLFENVEADLRREIVRLRSTQMLQKAL